jgi:hypothetical protein
MARTEYKNNELNEKIETITNLLKQAAGTIKILPKVKIEEKDLRSMFKSGKIPPELIDYV